MRFLIASFGIPKNLVMAYLVLAVSLVWFVGLSLLKWQFGRIPEAKQPPNWAAEFPGFDATPAGPIKIKEIPGETDTSKAPNLEKIVEFAAGRSLATGEIDMELKFKKGSSLNVFGQECEVVRGKIVVKPTKIPSQDIRELFKLKKKKV